ncbi:MAG: DHHA1 domain-containing protein [bacterium]|nr:DHHA1 domain-containing protein [bacterium]
MKDSRSIKAVLDEMFAKNDTVFIVPHSRPDFDALGASIGMSLISKKCKKKCYIIIDDDIEKLDQSTRKVLGDIKGVFDIIKSKDVPKVMGDSNLMITVDVNKDYLISEGTKKLLDSFNDIVILDHHKPDEHTIKTSHAFIDESLSSICEEISRLMFLYGVKITPDCANYLLSGILLDTNKFTKNTSPSTFEVIAKLTQKGGDTAIASQLFLEDFEDDRKMLQIVNDVAFTNYGYAVAGGVDDLKRIYSVEDIAKAADYLLKYRVNATFAMGYIDEDTISVSARSKGMIDVSNIMAILGGGGHETSAAARIKGRTIKEVKQALNSLLVPGNYMGWNIEDIKEDIYKVIPENKEVSLKLKK